MKTIILDFKSVLLQNGRMNGGSFFAIQLTNFLLKSEKKVFVINNTTQYFNELNIDIAALKKDDSEKLTYIDPLFSKLNDSIDDQLFEKYFFYIHGTRLLEMPYDKTSYKYSKGLSKFKLLIKQTFFKKYYTSKIKKEVSKLVKIDKSTIITPSEHSKYIIKTFVNLPIKVIPPFVSENILKDNVNFKSYCDEYILMLNSERWVKNSYRFIKAFSELKKTYKIKKDLKLIVVGKPIFARNFENDIIYLDYVERENLEFLMKEAKFLAYPSLNEGFGYPPLDCFKYGVPVLCSSISATNIIYNGFVTFVNPFSEIEIQSRILYLLDLIKNNRIDRNVLKEKYFEVNREIDNKWNAFLDLI